MLNNKVKFYFFIILILTIIPMNARAINPNNVIESTRVSNDINNITFDFTLIHPDEYISYWEINSPEEIEQELKKDYDLVLVDFRLSEARYKHFNLYEFKNNIKLTVDGETVESIDFFDISFSTSGRAYWDSDALDYRARANISITGYLLFPKTIDENSKKIKLEGSYRTIHEEGYTLYLSDDWDESNDNNTLEYNIKWDFERIDRLVDLLKN